MKQHQNSNNAARVAGQIAKNVKACWLKTLVEGVEYVKYQGAQPGDKPSNLCLMPTTCANLKIAVEHMRFVATAELIAALGEFIAAKDAGLARKKAARLQQSKAAFFAAELPTTFAGGKF